MYKENAKQLLDFIENSPSVFHVIENTKEILNAAGFQELKEHKKWTLDEKGKYYTTRNGSSLIAFTIPSKKYKGYQIDIVGGSTLGNLSNTQVSVNAVS